MYVRGLRKRNRTFEDQAKERSGNQTLSKTKDNSRKKQSECFHDESGDEPNALDELPLGESYRINQFLLVKGSIIDSLISPLSQRISAYSSLSKKFCFFAKFGLGEASDGNLSSAKKLVESSYPEDLEPELETELVYFDAFLNAYEKEELFLMIE